MERTGGFLCALCFMTVGNGGSWQWGLKAQMQRLVLFPAGAPGLEMFICLLMTLILPWYHFAVLEE